MLKVTVLFMCVTAAFGWKAISTINTNLEAIKPVRVILKDSVGIGRIDDEGIGGLGGIGGLRGGIGIGRGIGLGDGIGIGKGIGLDESIGTGGLGRSEDDDIGIGRGIGGGAVSWGRIDRGGKGW